MDDVACYGSETTLAHCSHSSNHNCDHISDASVVCQPCKFAKYHKMDIRFDHLFHLQPPVKTVTSDL